MLLPSPEIGVESPRCGPPILGAVEVCVMVVKWNDLDEIHTVWSKVNGPRRPEFWLG